MTTRYRDFNDYDSLVYQNEVDTRISYSRRDVIRVETITDENFNKEKIFISNITNEVLWTIKLELPFVEKNIHNYKILRDKVLIEYNYSEDQYKKDKKIMSEHSNHLKYGQWGRSTIKEMTESSMRIQNYEDNNRKLSQFNRNEQ